MKTTSLLAIALAASIASTRASAADTPRDAYDLDVICAAVANVAATHELPAGPNAVPDPHAAATLQTFYEKRALGAAGEAGVAADRVPRDIEGYERSILQKMNATDPARAQAEKNDSESMLRNCAALPVFELQQKFAK